MDQEQQAAPTPVAAPVADSNQSLMVAWRAAEAASPTDPAPVEADAADEAPADPEPAKTKGKATPAPAAVDAPDEEDAQFRALAEKRGFKIEDNRVTVAERAKLREEKRENMAKVAQLREQLGQQVGAEETRLKPHMDAAKCWEARDFDGFARALGHKDYNDMQKTVLEHHTDPSHRKVVEMERKLAEKEAAETRAAEQGRQTAAQRERAEAINSYKSTLSQELKAHTDPLAKALAEDPMFVNAVYALQDSHYDSDSDSTLSIDEALDATPKGGKVTLRAELKLLYERLRPAFEASAAGGTPVPGKKTGKTGATKREAEVPHVSKPGGNGFMDPKEREYWAQQLKSSDA